MSDFETVNEIQTKVGQPVEFKMAEDACIELSLASSDYRYHGLIRHHTSEEKAEILKLVTRLKRLRKLDLCKNKLLRLPGAIGELTDLEHLHLGSNYLGSVPPELENLKKLRFLHIANNDLQALPQFIGDLSNLEYLALHKNIHLTSIEPVAGLKNLRVLNAFLIRLKELPEFIYGLTELRSLTLAYCQVIRDDIARLSKLEFFTNVISPKLEELPEGLMHIPSLRMLRLFQNSLRRLPNDIGNLVNLEQISVYQNYLTELPASFRRLQKLEKLNIGWNRFESLPEYLPELASLRWLAIFENPLQAPSPETFPDRVEVVTEWPFSSVPPEQAPVH